MASTAPTTGRYGMTAQVNTSRSVMTRQYERPALSRAESARCAPAPACFAPRTAGFAQTLLRPPPPAATLGAAQGEFRQPTCAWSVDFSFAACCATEAFEAGGQPCAFGETTYANCCTDLTPLPPKYWCGDDPSFTDGAGFTCADWAAGEFSCVDDTATYTDGDRSALWAACAASCGLCQEWQGEAACWSGTFSYTSCCTGDGDEDGSPGDENCWTAEHNYDTCQCVEPAEPVAPCDQDLVLGAFVLAATACDYGPLAVGQPGYTVPAHGLCVWEELWGNGYCDSAANSPNGPSYDPSQAAWYNVWHANLNCAEAGFGALLHSLAALVFLALGT